MLKRYKIDLKWAVTEQKDSCDYEPENPCTDDPLPETLGESIIATLKIWAMALKRYMEAGSMPDFPWFGDKDDVEEPRTPRRGS